VLEAGKPSCPPLAWGPAHTSCPSPQPTSQADRAPGCRMHWAPWHRAQKCITHDCGAAPGTNPAETRSHKWDRQGSSASNDQNLGTNSSRLDTGLPAVEYNTAVKKRLYRKKPVDEPTSLLSKTQQTPRAGILSGHPDVKQWSRPDCLPAEVRTQGPQPVRVPRDQTCAIYWSSAGPWVCSVGELCEARLCAGHASVKRSHFPRSNRKRKESTRVQRDETKTETV
jgi:hypothetical protein